MFMNFINQMNLIKNYIKDILDFKQINTQKVFGNGVIAILFICNTGNASDELYSNNIVSFAAELLKNNYKAVIAPFWKLDVTIPSIWLQEFLKTFQEGYSVNKSVYFANKEIAKYQESISNSFYAVEGQLAMHLYGNPNIYIESMPPSSAGCVVNQLLL